MIYKSYVIGWCVPLSLSIPFTGGDRFREIGRGRQVGTGSTGVSVSLPVKGIDTETGGEEKRCRKSS